MAAKKKLDDAVGGKAIIELQAIVGITETPEQAKTGWAAMSPEQREQTMLAHRTVCGKN